MVDEWAAFGQRIDAMKGLTRGRLSVAVVSTAKYFVPRLLGSFCASHPDIDIALEILNRDGVVARLKENRDDLYIMSMPPSTSTSNATPSSPTRSSSSPPSATGWPARPPSASRI